jgi:hypothetical protein
MDNKNDLPSTTIVLPKNRLVLPPILSRQRKSSSSSLTSNATTSLDVETNNRFALSSKQNSFMKSISETL